MSKKNIIIGSLLGIATAISIISAKNILELRAQRNLKDQGSVSLLFLPQNTFSKQHYMLKENSYLQGPRDGLMKKIFFREKFV